VMNLLIDQSDTHTGSLTQTLVAFSPQEAYAGITLLAIASDTDLADEELGAIDRQLAQMHLFQHFQPQTMHRMYQKLFTILQRDGEDVLLASVRETLPSELREAAFASASDLVFADGMISPEESSFLIHLSQALEIPMGTATRILGETHLKCSYNHALSNA
jgi:tellurite resistance protein